MSLGTSYGLVMAGKLFFFLFSFSRKNLHLINQLSALKSILILFSMYQKSNINAGF